MKTVNMILISVKLWRDREVEAKGSKQLDDWMDYISAMRAFMSS